MSLFHIAKSIKSSSPWGRLGGVFRLAVVGAPSSGKTYLLSDLVMALGAMGYKQEKLPLTAQCSSLGQFFYDAGNANTGGIGQTEVYACRGENHYGGVFSHPNKMGKLEIDFLNIPGEVFADNNKRMDMFFDLKDCISKIDKTKLVMTRFVNPAGREQLIIEPSAQIRSSLHLDPNPQPAANEASISYRKQNYLRWEFIFAELSSQHYERKESKAVPGKYILKHFFELNTDSIIQTLTDIWETLPMKLDFFDYEANNILQFAYFLLYCSQATDIILCDKLFANSQGGDVLQTGGYDFESLTKQLCNFIEHQDSKRPHIHLAFRGADIIMKQILPLTTGQQENVRKVAYDALMKHINDIMQGKATQSSSQSPSPNREGWGGSSGWGGSTLTGMPLDQHILTRIGSSLGYGFWHLLNKTEPTGFIAKAIRSLRGQQSIHELYSSPNRPVIPPHVFFTATPIDIDMNIYDNDKDNVTVFIKEDDDTIKSFHIETACRGTQSMCLGTYQLLEEILSS